MQHLIGKNLEEAKEMLLASGVTDIEVRGNDSRREITHDSVLVVQARVEGKKAVLITSRFLLENIDD
jgi:hypothetical protein